MNSIMLKVENLSKEYRLGQIGMTTLKSELKRRAELRRGNTPTNTERFLALDNVSFEVKKGERVGIIGHNGAGKSTLLKIISRITTPTDGAVYLNGRVSSMLEVGTGFNRELTGRENIYMNGAILGMTKKEIDKKIESIIDFSECRKFIDTPVKRYSSGMYVKLAFSVAAHLDSEIMIMDEVLAVGDRAFQYKCIEKMKEISLNEDRTVLYVSHNMATIRDLCDRCIVLSGGKAVFDGDVDKAIEIYTGIDNKEGAVSYDFSNTVRPFKRSGEKVFINGFSFCDKTVPVFKTTEPIKFDITFKTNKEVSGLRFALSVLKGQKNYIGTAQTENANDYKPGEYKKTFSLDVSNLSPGSYEAEIMAFGTDLNGNILCYDRPGATIGFDISECGDIKWKDKFFGAVKLNDIKSEEK